MNLSDSGEACKPEGSPFSHLILVLIIPAPGETNAAGCANV